MLPFSLQAIENINSKKLFILLEYPQPNRMTIINPEGQILTVPDGLFNPPYSISADEYQSRFTGDQISAVNKFYDKNSSKTARKAKTTTRKASTPKAVIKPGVVAEWRCAHLTFYKHKIDPLHETQSFKVLVDDVGEIQLTKMDFLKYFSDVLLSPSFQHEGSYMYPSFPDKAKKFLIS